MTGFIELDLIPEGTVPPALIRDLASARRIDISGIFAPEGHLGGYAPGLSPARIRAAIATVVTRPEDHLRLLAATIEASAEAGVLLCECRIAPDLCAGGDASAFAELVAGATELAAKLDEGIALSLVAEALRARGPERSRHAALLAAENSGGLLAGFALAGDEGIGAARDYAWAFDCAREAGLGRTVEVGSLGDATSIRDTLADLRPDRLAGALRLAEDPALVEDLAERGITTVLCPAMDIALGRSAEPEAKRPAAPQTRQAERRAARLAAEAAQGASQGAVTTARVADRTTDPLALWRAHPAGRLYHRGARLALVTTAPAILMTTPARDRERLHEAFDWDEGVFSALAECALDAAFCGTDTRDRLRKTLHKSLHDQA